MFALLLVLEKGEGGSLNRIVFYQNYPRTTTRTRFLFFPRTGKRKRYKMVMRRLAATSRRYSTLRLKFIAPVRLASLTKRQQTEDDDDPLFLLYSLFDLALIEGPICQ
jgi:hypothetical protein